jgi:uncharacterized oxidoreductase
MKMSSNTFLITGGTSGVGLELAVRLLELGNTVVVTGRDSAKLKETKQRLPAVSTIQSDAADSSAIAALHAQLTRDFPDLNVIVNNAGVMRKINLHEAGKNIVELTREIEIDLMGPIRMVAQFLPHLKTKQAAAIVNVSSALAFVPFPIAPVYCAAKAGLHSFTQSLRVQLKNTSVKVFELTPPALENPSFAADFDEEDMKGASRMDVASLVKRLIAGLSQDTMEIRPGQSNTLALMSRIAPRFIIKQLAKPADRMLAGV